MANYTQAQLQAIEAPVGAALRVLASPGSGKTHLLCGRYKFLVDHGVSPNGIIAVTFSKSMADELGERIAKTTPTANRDQICTIHALCYRLLKSEGDTRRVAYDWQVRQIIEEEQTKYPKLKDAGWKEIRSAIDGMKMHGIPSDVPASRSFLEHTQLEPWADPLARIRWEYDRRMRTQGMLTFADMLLDVELALRKDEKFRSKYQALFTHVMIDEGQDTSGQAMRILTTLAAPQNALTIVGDSDQLLYRFSGATPEINLFGGFEHQYPDGLLVKLDRNFRSTGEVVSRCSALIGFNYAALGGPYEDKYLKAVQPRAEAPVGNPFTVDGYEDADEEARAVASSIEQAIASGRQPAEFFVAARTRAQLGYMEGPLARARIPFVNACGGSFWNSKHIADVLGYLELAYTDSTEAFERVYDISSSNMLQPFTTASRQKGDYSPNRWLGKKFLESWTNLASREKNPMRRAQLVVREHENGWRWRDGVRDLDNMLGEVKEALSNSLAQALSVIIANYTDVLKADGMVEGDVSEDGKLEDYATVIDLSNEFSNNPGEFLNYIKDCQKAAAADSWDGKVVISTVHRLKGLERPVVYVIGCNENLLPHRSATEGMPPMGVLPLSSNGKIEDERCIMFVAASRAKEEVHLSHISKWRNKPVVPSRFISEMGIEIESTQEETDE